MSLPHRISLLGLSKVLVLAILGLALAAPPAAAQLSNEQMADVLLNSARKAYNDKKYPIATAKFREYLHASATSKTPPAVRHGLALVLLEGPVKKYAEARDLLQPIAATKDFPEHASILYHLGLACAAWAWRSWPCPGQTAGGPAAPAKCQEKLRGSWQAILRRSTCFHAARLQVPLDQKELPAQLEWAIRALRRGRNAAATGQGQGGQGTDCGFRQGSRC